MIDIKTLCKADPEVGRYIAKELERQRGNIELIASENFVSPAVMSAVGTFLTNKYAEGYPSKRYYGGCEFVDEVERLAIERAKKLFNAEYANVQPHSGANANLATFLAFMDVGDTVLSMNLAHGGHLSHGSPVNFSGKNFNIISYGVNAETGYIDYDELENLALKNMPKLILAGASAYPRAINFKKFREIANLCGAILMVDIAHIAGLIIAGEHENPFPYADVVTSTTHKTLRGPRGGLILAKEKYATQLNKAIFPGTQGGPLMHVIAGKAVAFGEASSQEFKDYQHQVVLNSKAMASRFLELGIKLVSGGTDNHLMLVDLRDTGINGKELEQLLDKARITVNKNTIPNDTQSPFITSGIRIGTPAVTTRGMKEEEMRKIAELIVEVINKKESAIGQVSKQVDAICAKYPLYAGDIIE